FFAHNRWRALLSRDCTLKQRISRKLWRPKVAAVELRSTWTGEGARPHTAIAKDQRRTTNDGPGARRSTWDLRRGLLTLPFAFCLTITQAPHGAAPRRSCDDERRHGGLRRGPRHAPLPWLC